MIRQALAKVAQRENLSEAEMTAVMEEISAGRATPAQIGALLIGLCLKGESVEEITAAARVLRAKSITIPLNSPKKMLVDTCGTGGDGAGTFNVSTTAAFVVAGCGLRVAKHGNRAVSSRCGSADVLEALGATLELAPSDVAECIERVGIGFLYAPLLHPAMGHAVRPRREVGLKSIFNLVGPLTNPAGATVQVLGVFRPDLTETMAQVLQRLGCRSAFVVFGEGGYDEITITGPSRVTRLFKGQIRTRTLRPEEVGLRRAGPEKIRGGDAARNAALTLGVLKGEKGACRDMVLLNAAAVVVAAGRAESWEEGLRCAAESIDSGRALEKLEGFISAGRQMASRPRAGEA